MNPAQLLGYFDRISNAPDAITRLRRFILDLAVRGKLVEQDPNEEPASQLLTRIQAEKARLVSKRDLKKSERLPPLEDGETPFELPKSWVWIRIGDGFLYDVGAKREPKELEPSRWLLELEDIEKDTSRVLARFVVSDRDSLSTKSEFQASDILYGKLRPYLNKVVVALEPGYSTTEIVAIRPFLPLCSAYCSIAFRRPDFVEYVTRLGRGTKMPRLRTPDAVVAVFPLPPLPEQHRIVAKVDELMALCDQLEAAQAERERRRDRLAAASLQRLNAPADVSAFREHANFHLRHLARLTTRPDQVPALRQTILNLAIRGRLVARDPNDEPAVMLLDRLAVAARRFSMEHTIAPSRPEPIDEAALPHPAPPGWTWTRLCSLFYVITDGDHLPPPKSDDGIAFLTIGNITTGRLDFSNCRFVSAEYFESVAEYRRPARGDILYTVVGATYGRPAFVDTDRKFCVQRHIAILKPACEVDVTFLCRLLASPLIYEQATRSTTGTAQPTIPLRPLRNFLVPLPPLKEQHRIVAKVDELMALCDRLEAQLTTAQTESRRLLEAVLHEALADAGSVQV